MAQPARLRWHITAPLEQQIITDGNLLWLFDPDLEQVVIQPFDRDIAATPAILFPVISTSWTVPTLFSGRLMVF